MYRLLVYGLAAVLMVAAILSFSGVMSTSGVGIICSTVVLIAVCYAWNKIFAKLYGAIINNESWLITALIIACILPPSTSAQRLGYIAFAGFVAMASKFVLVYRHKQIFNPAVVAAVAVSLGGLMSVTWWIGNPAMLPSVLILGFLVLRKVRKVSMAVTFVMTALLTLTLVAILTDQDAGLLLKNAVLSGPLLFFASIMLTEPSTTPSLHYYQILYGVLVGTLYSAQLRFGIFSTSPHIVLALGNLFVFAVNPKVKLRMRLKDRVKISNNVYDYVFTPDWKFDFIPGQYMEWTLCFKDVDGRGNRRSFTLASSPTESDVHVGLKFYEPSSSFKRALSAMKKGDIIEGGPIAGNFILSQDASEKLVFIAGGVGITPFRSMIKYLTDKKERRDIVLFYIVADKTELAYKEVWAEAKGVKFVPVVAGRLTPELLELHAPDYKDRHHYISGPNGFVDMYKDVLKEAGVTKITTDHFSGY